MFLPDSQTHMCSRLWAREVVLIYVRLKSEAFSVGILLKAWTFSKRPVG